MDKKLEQLLTRVGSIKATYSGSGDEGYIDNIYAPSTATDDSTLDLTVNEKDAVEEVVYAILEREHDGWEIDDGASGEAILKLKNGKLEYALHHQENYMQHTDSVNVGEFEF